MIKALWNGCLLPGMILAAGVSTAQAVEPPGETAIPIFANHEQAFYRLPSLLVTGQGTVLAAGQKRIGSNGDFAPSSLVLRRSSASS